MSLHCLPSVKPSAIAAGTVFNHAIELAIMGPLFGDAFRRAKASNSNEEWLRSKEATGAAIAWGTSFIGSGLQAYSVGALINATGTLSLKGAAYLGGLIFLATSAPGFLTQVFTEKRPLGVVSINALSKAVESIGLSLFMCFWGTRTNPFESYSASGGTPLTRNPFRAE